MLLKRNSGFTILELLLAAALIAFLGLLTAQVMTDAAQSAQTMQMMSVRDQIAIWTRSSAGNIKNLTASLKQAPNTAFYNCVCGQGSGCTSATPADFFLYDATTTPLATFPAYYDTSGNPCANQNAANCAFYVKISFVAQCAPPLPSSYPYPPYTCSQAAEFFGITFSVQQNPNLPANSNYLKPIGSTVFMASSELAPSGSGVCP